MAKELAVITTCDMDSNKTPAVGEVQFSRDGWSYTLDLCAEHLAEFGAFEAAGTKTRTGSTPKRRRPRVARAPSTTRPVDGAGDALREWARANGYTIGNRGRIPVSIRAAYEAVKNPSRAEPAVEAVPAQAVRPRKSAAKKAARAGKRPAKKAAATPVAATSGIRSWAQANGHQIGLRGRIPAAVREAYEAAISTPA